MSQTIDIYCLGMKCPRPIIELAKSARKSTPGSMIRIQADDLAFESDLRAWCETTGAHLVKLHSEAHQITAVIQIPTAG